MLFCLGPPECRIVTVCASILVCPATFSMQSISLFLSFFLESKPTLCFFHLAHTSPFFILPPFAPIFISCLMSHSSLHSPLLSFSLHLFASSLSTPSSLLWSDHKANLIKQGFIRPLSIFPGVFSCVYVCVLMNKAYLSLTDLPDREPNLSELTGLSNNIHFGNVWLQAAVVLQVDRKWNFLQCRMRKSFETKVSDV